MINGQLVANGNNVIGLLVQIMRLLRATRYVFLFFGIVFIGWEASEVLHQKENFSFWMMVEIGAISVLGPTVWWISSKRGERLASKASQYHAELLTSNGMNLDEITAYKQQVAALRSREQGIRAEATALVRAQEQELRQAALEVDDHIAQLLTVIWFRLQQMDKLISKEKVEARQTIQDTSVLLREAMHQSWNVRDNLYPLVLDKFSVVAVIEAELRTFRDDVGCRVTFDVDFPVVPPQDVSVTLYRVFHEALANIRGHAAGVENVIVSLTYVDQMASLLVQDNGPGFELEKATEGKLTGGLMRMRSRVEIADGTLEVTASPGQGTKVKVRLPIDGSNH